MLRLGLGSLALTLRSLAATPAPAEAFISLAQGPATPIAALTSLLPLLRGGGAAAPPARPFSAAAGAEEESIEEARARIFGTHIGNGLRSGRKVLRVPLLGAKLAAYYPDDIIKADPMMVNLRAEKAKLKLDRLKRRGKAPPKKGAGKRAGKK
jgi:small subunit ribosomal protein S33